MASDLPVTGNTERTRPENRSSYPALDGLRAIAILLVFFQHYWALPWGWAGVDIFFVLSGFLITGILFDTRNNPDRVRTFYIRRALRIFPLFYAVMLALLITWPILHWHFSWGWLAWPTYVGNFTPFIHPYADHSHLQQLADFQPTGTFNGSKVMLYLGHFWSLCVEEQFYFVWPWLVFWINSRRKLLWVCAIMVPLTLLLRLFAAHHAPSWMIGNLLLERCTFFRLDSLLLGGLLALVLRGPAREAILFWSRRLLAVVVAALVIAMVIPSMRHWLSLPGNPEVNLFTWRLTVIDCLAALLVLAAIQPGTLVFRCLHLYPLRWLGRISYGFYVFHDILHWQIASWLLPPGVYSGVAFWRLAGTWVIPLVITVVASWLSFHFFESRFLELKERWASPRVSAQLEQPAM